MKSTKKNRRGSIALDNYKYNANISQWSKSERAYLVDSLPLKAPLSIQFEPSGACNFKCNYCFRQEAEYISNNKMVTLDIFKKFIDDCHGFEIPIKTLMFARLGEPTLNKYLPEMIAYAKKSGCVNQIKVITNGSMLTPELNYKLLEAGLDVLRISLQGLTREEYLKICQYDMDFEKLVANIKHFYLNKDKCTVFIKIIDNLILGREKLFFERFGNICDEIAIEHLVDTSLNSNVTSNDRNMINMMQEEVSSKIICCPMPFYSLHINGAGDIKVCSIDALHLGNISTDNISKIWRGSTLLKGFRLMQLKGERFKNNSICSQCSIPSTCLQSSDHIDSAREHLEAYYK